MGSTDRGGTTSKLRLRGPQVERRDLGGRGAFPEAESLEPEDGDASRRWHPPRRRQPSRLRRVHGSRSVADQQRRVSESRGKLFPRQREGAPLSAQTLAGVAVEARLDFVPPRLPPR